MSQQHPNITSKLPFADYSKLLKKYPTAFMGIVEDEPIYHLIIAYDVYIDKLYSLAAQGQDWELYFDSIQREVFIQNFKETCKRLDRIKADNLKKNMLSETVVVIKH